MIPPIIELKNIVFSYDDDPILKDISFAIEKGSYYGIIGPNGGGKTTLLKIILGLIAPKSGEIKLFGQDINDFVNWSRIGYLPQKIAQSSPNFPITVEEVVSQGRVAKVGLFKKFKPKDIKAIQTAMKLVDINHLHNRLIADLSGGERQRVYMARALASEPQVLLLDEPVTGVDVASQSKFYQFLKILCADHGLTILFVSHDVGILAHEAQKLICVNRRLVCQGPVHYIFKENQNLLKDLYGENVKMSFEEI